MPISKRWGRNETALYIPVTTGQEVIFGGGKSSHVQRVQIDFKELSP